MPKFSVIIASYNQREKLMRCLEALEKQTFKDFDVHVCDDGSTDGTVEYMNNLIDLKEEKIFSFPFYFHTQRNKGNFGANLNQGVRKAQGEYCVFFAADSFPDGDYLEQLNEYAAPHRIICGMRIQIHEDKAVDFDFRFKKAAVPQDVAILAHSPWQRMTGNGLTVPTDAFREYGLWDESFKTYGGEDDELVARLYFKGYVCYSVPYLRLFHQWHISNEGSEENRTALNRKIYEYSC